MLTYRYVDDGWYCVGYWVYDGEERFAETQSEAAAVEIVNAVNLIRKLGKRIHDIAQSEFGCEPIDPRYVSDLRRPKYTKDELPSCGHEDCLGLTRCSFKHD